MIGDPLALFVLPAIVGMAAVLPSGAQGGQYHRLGIERLLELQLNSDSAEAFFHETQNNFAATGHVAQLFPVDDRMSRVVSDLCQRGLAIVDLRQQTTIIVADRIRSLSNHLRGSGPVSQETSVQRVPLCTGSARCMMKDGKIKASPRPRAIRLQVPSP